MKAWREEKRGEENAACGEETAAATRERRGGGE